MVRIAVNGAGGKMGTRILALASENAKEFRVEHAFDIHGIGQSAGPVSVESLQPYAEGKKTLRCDVLIDFSGPEGAGACSAAANFSKKALVVGSTGLEGEVVRQIEKTAALVPVVVSSNMSVGVNVMLKLLGVAAESLSEEYRVSVSETHHTQKKDWPSGTALMLVKKIAQTKKWVLDELLTQWKKSAWEKGGHLPASEVNKIGMKVIREGAVAERIEITHHAKSRDTFARGALVAAQFAAKQKPGYYTMADVLK
jgi:4-hydroxy-tetrahydrodipicolinate reductase